MTAYQMSVFRRYWGLHLAVALLTTAVLLYGVVEQLYDTNFYVLWEATSLLAGDHPYRDFFQMGWPLLTVISTVGQWASGYRLIGEFAIQWLFLIASSVLGFHLALRLSRSVTASLVTTLVGIVILLSTPTFNFPKLFFYPVAVLVAWWYMERPGTRRAATIGLVTAVAFLYRHDHGVYIGVAAALAFVLTRIAVPQSRNWRSSIREIAALAAAAGVVLVPWAIVVQLNEGLLDYVRTRAEWGRTWAPGAFPYLGLRDLNPLAVFRSDNDHRLSVGNAVHWLLQITMLLPLLTLVSAGLDARAQRRTCGAIALETYQLVLAALLATIVAIRLFREDGYFVAILPLSVAFGARFLANPVDRPRAWRAPQLVVALGVLAVTAVAAVGSVDGDLFAASEFEELAPTYRQLFASPPIDGYKTAADAHEIDAVHWRTIDNDTKRAVLIRYLHDCTRNGDRLFVTGSTPYQVGYYAERPIAGGQLQWHHRWRSDAEHEAQSLRLIERQSVPFAFSTHDPVLDDLEAYPRIRDYFATHYTELPGSGGLLLIDTRRQPTGRFGAVGFPCFR
jgi:hypothetical protein